MSDRDGLRAAINEALQSGGTVPLGRSVLCDFCDEDMTESTVIGGLLFQSKAACPGCAPRIEASARGYGEERFIRARCPKGMTFADWVRGMRGPGAASRVAPGISAIRSLGGDPS